MKVLKKGRTPNRQESLPWWQRCKHECANCGAVFQLEDGDPVDVVTERSPFGTSRATSTCPTCAARVTTDQKRAQVIVYR